MDDYDIIDVKQIRVVYMDSHFTLMICETEDQAVNHSGRVLGHYLSGDLANEALNTMRTIAGLGYGDTIRWKKKSK